MIRLRNPPNMVGLIICLEMTSVSLRSHVRRVFFFVWGQIEGCEENERSGKRLARPQIVVGGGASLSPSRRVGICIGIAFSRVLGPGAPTIHRGRHCDGPTLHRPSSTFWFLKREKGWGGPLELDRAVRSGSDKSGNDMFTQGIEECFGIRVRFFPVTPHEPDALTPGGTGLPGRYDSYVLHAKRRWPPPPSCWCWKCEKPAQLKSYYYYIQFDVIQNVLEIKKNDLNSWLVSSIQYYYINDFS